MQRRRGPEELKKRGFYPFEVNVHPEIIEMGVGLVTGMGPWYL